MTNREWLMSLTNKQLAEFLTEGLYVRWRGFNYEAYMNPSFIARRSTVSRLYIEEWLDEKQEFDVVEGEPQY